MARSAGLPRSTFEALLKLRAAARRGTGAVGRWPLAARAIRPVFEARVGTCWGVFGTFAEAAAAAPRSRPVGYDNQAAAGLYRDLVGQVEPKDYAVAFWLQRRLKPGNRVFDFGGHVGLKFYALQAVLPLPEGVAWVTYDLPAVVAAGCRLAAERGARGLSFTESFEDASGAEVFMALGSLQYVEAPLARQLERLQDRPRYVIVSSTPMSDHPRYVTLQNIGASYCPYLVENRAELVRGMTELGYELVHSWANPEKRCKILGRPDRSVEGYTSMHFALAGHA